MPHFIKQIHIKDAKALEYYFKPFSYHNAHNLLTLVTWDYHASPIFYEIDQKLLIAKTYDISHKDELTYVLLADGNTHGILDTLTKLHTYGEDRYGNNWKKITLEFVIDDVAEQLRKVDNLPHRIEEVRDEFEYVYNAEKLANPTGKSMRRFKEKLLLFNRLYGEASIERIEKNSRSLAKMINTIHAWDISFTNSPNDLALSEGKVLNTLLTQQLDTIHVFALTLQGNPVAYAICYYSSEYHTLDLLHLKCNYNYRGVFDTTINAIAKYYIANHAISEINLSCDLGIPGIRQHKMGLRPDRFNKMHALIPEFN